MYNNQIVEALYGSQKYKQILDLYGYRMIFDKGVSEIAGRIFLSAYAWRSTDFLSYKRYSADILLTDNKCSVRKLLIKNIMRQIIKNEILML